MRHIPTLILALALVMTLVACGDPDKNKNLPGSGIGGSNYNGLIPAHSWDPGTKQNGGGYGYGYGYGQGGSYNDEVQVNCMVEPCVYGSCVVGNSTSSTYCDCDLGYTGRLCSECDEGYYEQGGLCIPEDACTQAHCVYGKCVTNNDIASCQCYAGYAGEKCDSCDTGYHIDQNSRTCVAD